MSNYESMSNAKETFIKELKLQLEKEGVSVEESVLGKSIDNSREKVLQDCSGCTNGWHW